MTMASLLADAPEVGGEPLKLWLVQKNMDLTRAMDALRPQHDLMRHQLGVSALRALTAGHLETTMQSQGGGIPPTSPLTQQNLLSPTTPPQGNA
jgi:hypothetical protein